MKKLLALLVVLTMVIGIMPGVSAAIPQNNGLGTAMFVDPASAAKNCSNTENTVGGTTATNKNWLNVSDVDLTGEPFDKAVLIKCNGTTAVPGTNQVRHLFTTTNAITSGDYVYVSFYYKLLSQYDGVEYTVAPPSFACTYLGKSSGNVKTIDGVQYNGYNGADGNVAYDEWKKVTYIYAVNQDIASGATTYVQMGFAKPSAGLSPYAVEIAGMTFKHLGAITVGEGEGTAVEQVSNALSQTSISAVSVKGTAVDLASNPSAYAIAEDITADDVVVTTTHGSADTVVKTVSQDGNIVTVKVYAPMTDVTADNATPSATYTIEKLQVKDPVVTVTENNGYGTGVVMAYETPAIATNAAREYNSLDVIKGEDAAPFDEYYSWTREEFEIEGTSNGCYISVSGTLPEGAKAGDWVYVSLYYRVYNRFTNSAGEVVDGSSADVTPAIRSNANDNPLYRSGLNTKYIRMMVDSEAPNDVGEWQKITYIQKLTYDTNESWTFKLTKNYAKNTETGTLWDNNMKIDFADIKIAYFGTPTSDTPDTDDSFYVAAIQNAAGNFGLSTVYVNGEEIDKNTNPLSYTTLTTPRYTAREKHSVVTGDTVHGAGMASVAETDGGFEVKSYPLDYDWLSGTDNRVASYTINEVAEYDFYDFELDGNTFTLKADNGLTDVKEGVIIGVSYNAMGKMLKLKAEPFSINGLANILSVTVPEENGVASYKFFVWDGINSSVPYVKTIVVDDVTTGNISQ